MNLSTATLAGFSGQALINGLTPTWGYTLYSDMAYAGGQRRRLDVYVPDAFIGDMASLSSCQGSN